MNVRLDESLPLPDSELDEILEATRAAFEPFRNRLVATRGEDWALTASARYRNREDARFRAFGTVDVNGRPRSTDDRSLEACLTVQENPDGPDTLVDAWTHSWLDMDDQMSGGYCVGERVVPLAEAQSAMVDLLHSLIDYLDQILARLDAGEREAVE
jgi:hypothetical protein